MVEHFCEPAPASTHRHGFEIHESWSDWLVVLSVNGEIDISPHRSSAARSARRWVIPRPHSSLTSPR